MYHLDNVSGVPEMPQPKEQQSISPRWFGESQEQGGISWPGADWFNIVQAELLSILEIAEEIPDKTKFNQIAASVKKLADNAVLLPQGGKVQDAIGYITPEMFRFGSLNDDDMLSAAFDYCRKNNIKTIYLYGRYEITRELNVPDFVRIIGTHHLVFNQGYGSSASLVPDINERASTPTDSAILWKGAPGATWLNCGSHVSISGVVFGAPDQNWGATTKAEIIDYGLSISGKSGLSVTYCLFYGMKTFASGLGSSIYFAWNMGFCTGHEFEINNSRDVNRVINNHINPNVIRPPESFWNCLVDDARYMIVLNNHDGTIMEGNHTFAVRGAVKSVCSSGYLGTIISSKWLLDQTAVIGDIDHYGDSPVIFTGVQVIGDNAANAGVSTAQEDVGYLILRKTNGGNITPVFIDQVWCQPASLPKTAPPKYAVNFQTSEGYVVHIGDWHVTGVEQFDNGRQSNLFTGRYSDSFRSFNTETKYTNLIPNPGWAYRIPSNQLPFGWNFSNCEPLSPGSKRVISNANGSYFSTRFRQLITERTYVITATSIGSSSGVTISVTNSSGVTTPTTVPWVSRGGKYYAVLTQTDSVVEHLIQIDAGQTGGGVTFEYAALVPGTGVLNFNNNYAERQPPAKVSGSKSYPIAISAGGTHTFDSEIAGYAGAFAIYVSTAIGVAIFEITKLSPTQAPTINSRGSAFPTGSGFTVTWPSGQLPSIKSDAAVTANITITGASYNTMY